MGYNPFCVSSSNTMSSCVTTCSCMINIVISASYLIDFDHISINYEPNQYTKIIQAANSESLFILVVHVVDFRRPSMDTHSVDYYNKHTIHRHQQCRLLQ